LSVTCGRSVVLCGSPFSSTNKTDRHDIAEILLKVALNTITTTPNPLLHLKHGKLSKVSCGAETAYPHPPPPPGWHDFTPGFSVVRSARSLVFGVMFYISLFVPCLFLAFVLSVLLRFTACDYHFGIFKLLSK
jgi:hypothetical protein